MEVLNNHEVMAFFLALGVLLAVARVLGEVAVRLHQPAVVGEILAGVLLGPTVMGSIAPHVQEILFPMRGALPVALSGITSLAIVLFLLVAGMEVDLSIIRRQGKVAIIVGMAGIVVPFALGLSSAWYFPGQLGAEAGSDRQVFSLFFATALSISALPVIAKMLLDLNMFRSDLGMIIIAAAIFNDVIGWTIFALVLGGGESLQPRMGMAVTIMAVVGFTVLMLSVGRWFLHRILPWVQAHTTWPAGVLGLALTGTFLCAALTEWMGLHAVFGAFIFGVALGDSRHLREQTRTTLDQFSSFIFAPLFFASIGLRMDFAANFDLTLCLIVLAIATAGKVFGCGFGARLSGLKPRESWAIGFGMNARGAMEIVLGLLALQAGIIGERLFVALVIMALVTSMTGGAFIQRLLQRRKPLRFTAYMSARAFCPNLTAADSHEAIEELAKIMCQGTDVHPHRAAQAVWEREEMSSTGLVDGIALPHARLKGLRTPLVAVGLSKSGVDFDSMDGKDARLICLILTPEEDHQEQLNIMADISRTFHTSGLMDKVMEARNLTEFLAILRSNANLRQSQGSALSASNAS